MLIRLVTGASWVDIEAILDHQVSDTTLRARRDEWIDAGVFERLKTEALAAFDRIVGLDLHDVALDGSLHKAPDGGEGTGPNPTDRAKLGWKWSVASEHHGIPIGWDIDGANRHDVAMLEPTLDAIRQAGLLADIGTLHLDRGYDSGAVRDRLRDHGIDQSEIQRRGTKVPAMKKQPVQLGLRWIVEATNTWWSNYGGRTTASSAATPTGEHATATPPSASPPSFSSLAAPSTGATAGARPDPYPLRSLAQSPMSTGRPKRATREATRSGPSSLSALDGVALGVDHEPDVADALAVGVARSGVVGEVVQGPAVVGDL
jgi:hypothetical protein